MVLRFTWMVLNPFNAVCNETSLFVESPRYRTDGEFVTVDASPRQRLATVGITVLVIPVTVGSTRLIAMGRWQPCPPLRHWEPKTTA